MIDISVIIPHKNIPQELKRCLDSIPILSNVEVIIVDDNSKLEITKDKDFPGLNRENTIVIFDNSGKGAGSARNIGLRSSKGKWIMFADADDFFHKNAFFKFLDMIKSNADFYIFDTDSVMSNTLEKVNNREDVAFRYKKTKDENILRYMHHSVWGKIFKKELCLKQGFEFQEVKASNDAYFAACYGVYAKTVEFVDYIGYCCTVRSGSICTRLSLDNVMARIKVVEVVNQLYANNKVKKKYWMNRLGPLFNLRSIDTSLFIFQFLKYLIKTPILRLIMDFLDSGSRYFSRIMGKVNDRDIKKLQIVK